MGTLRQAQGARIAEGRPYVTQRGSAERRSPLPFAQFGSRTEEMPESMNPRDGSMSLMDTTVGQQGGSHPRTKANASGVDGCPSERERNAYGRLEGWAEGTNH